MKHFLRTALLVSAVGLAAVPAGADTHADRLQALERRIEALEARIATLAARQTFTAFMPNFSERFHVMHRAGVAGDWAVAAHELAEMKRLTALSPSIDPVKGKLMQAMLAPSFKALEEAVKHGNQTKFGKALVQAIDACNACHTATDSGFIKVVLDARDSLSLRHPHRLMRQEAPDGHEHAAPAGTGGMMDSAPTGTKHHDDTGKPKHKHK